MNTTQRSCSTVFRDAENDSEKVTAFLSLSLSFRSHQGQENDVQSPADLISLRDQDGCHPAEGVLWLHLLHHVDIYVNVKQERVQHRMTSKQALRPVIQHNIFKHSVSHFITDGSTWAPTDVHIMQNYCINHLMEEISKMRSVIR